MSLVTFNNVRYYTADDPFHYTVDNRPLQDLASNDVLLQAAIDSIATSLSGGNVSSKIFNAGTDFTAGSSTQLTLPSAPFSSMGIWIFFDGIMQNDNTYNISSAVITFTSAIPSGVSTVEVKWVNAILLNTPSDGTVTDVKVMQGSSLSNRITGEISVKDPQFGAVGNGVINDTPAITAWLQYLLTNGGSGYVPPGTYLCSTSIIVTLNASVNIRVSSSANFVAASGFPAGYKLLQVLTGTNQVNVFKWIGGQFDGSNIPNSTAGQSNDIFGINATNVNHVHVELDRTYSGVNWLNSGADSHLFIAGGSESIVAKIEDCVGAWDAGIYISRDISGTLGGNLRVTGNFTGCNSSLIAKRQFQRAYMQATCSNCLNGVSVGSANITGVALANGGYNYTVIVNADRCENAAALQAMYGANVMVTATNIGVSISGYTSTQAAGLRVQGSQFVSGTVVATGVNSACTVNNNFNGIRTEQMVITSGTLQSTDNMFNVTTGNLGRPFRENDSSDRNTFISKDYGSTTIPAVVGANTVYISSVGTPRWTFYGTINRYPLTYSQLPATPAYGDEAVISDSTVSTFRAVVSAGGGSSRVKIWYNGSSWLVCG